MAESDKRLVKGWKAIAAHLGVSPRTAQRWKREGMPVSDRIIADTRELDDWVKVGKRNPPQSTGVDVSASEVSAGNDSPAIEPPAPAAPRLLTKRARFWWASGAVFVIMLVFALIVKTVTSHHPVIASHEPPLRPRRFLAPAMTEGHKPFRIKLEQPARYILITPDGTKLFAISPGQGLLTVVDLRDLRVKQTLKLPHSVNGQFLSANGRRLYIAAPSPDAEIMVVDTQAERVVETIPTRKPVFSVAASQDDKKLFLAMAYEGLKEMDMSTREIRTLSALACPMFLAIDADGKRLFVSYQCGGPGGRRGHNSVDVYDIQSERSVETIKDLPFVGGPLILSPSGNVLSMDGLDACISPAYDHIACPAVPMHVIHLWDVPNHRLLATIPPQIKVSEVAAFSRTGSRILFTGPDLVVWDWAHGTILEKTQLSGADSLVAAITPSEDRLVVSLENVPELLILDAEKEPCLPPISGLANYYSGDGTLYDSEGVGSLASAAAPQFSAGWSGQAFRFTGKNEPLQAVAGGTYCTFCVNEWTVSLFIKLATTDGEMTILEHEGIGSSAMRRIYKTRDNHFSFQSDDGVMISGANMIKAGTWYHLAVVGDPRHVRFYVDGELQGEASLKQPFIQNNRAAVLIGGSQRKHTPLNGLVDELSVYTRALTALEVKSFKQTCPESSE